MEDLRRGAPGASQATGLSSNGVQPTHAPSPVGVADVLDVFDTAPVSKSQPAPESSSDAGAGGLLSMDSVFTADPGSRVADSGAPGKAGDRHVAAPSRIPTEPPSDVYASAATSLSERPPQSSPTSHRASPLVPAVTASFDDMFSFFDEPETPSPFQSVAAGQQGPTSSASPGHEDAPTDSASSTRGVGRGEALLTMPDGDTEREPSPPASPAPPPPALETSAGFAPAARAASAPERLSEGAIASVPEGPGDSEKDLAAILPSSGKTNTALGDDPPEYCTTASLAFSPPPRSSPDQDTPVAPAFNESSVPGADGAQAGAEAPCAEPVAQGAACASPSGRPAATTEELAQEPGPVPELLAELAEWEDKRLQQAETMAASQAARASLRAQVEELQKQIAALTKDKERCSEGLAAEVRKMCNSLVGRRAELAEETARLELTITEQEQQLGDLQVALKDHTHEASTSGSRSAAVAEEAEALVVEATKVRNAMEKAEVRLRSMVAVDEVQKYEGEAKQFAESIRRLSQEISQLRVALADALSSASDMQNTKHMMDVLKESVAQSAERVNALEEINAKLRGKLEQVNAGIAQLRTGTVDLSSEGELMREVIVQQSENLARRIEDLTEERKVADADRSQLLDTTARLTAAVDDGEARLRNRTQLEGQIEELETSRQILDAEVERLRRTNDALCQQALGDEAEGPYSGALSAVRMTSGDAAADQLFFEVSRLVHGQPLQSTPGGGGPGGASADAAALALRLQQTLAEREEAFWLERQRLSDRVTSLERARGGRTGSLLREYDAAVRGKAAAAPRADGASSNASGGAAAAAATAAGTGLAVASAAGEQAAAAMTGGIRKLRDTMFSG